MAEEVHVDKDNFQKEVVDHPGVVLADFWADWCMPCKMMDPVIKQLAEEYGEKLKVVKVNVDQAGDLATDFNIVSIPTLIIFSAGKEVKRQIGALPRHTVEAMIKEYIQ